MTIKHILVATDFSECSKHAGELAIDLALQLDADLTLTHSCEIPDYGYGCAWYVPSDFVLAFQTAAQQELDAALLSVKLRLPRATSLLRSGASWEQILNAAKWVGADLIVMGTHGRRGVSRALAGSVAERVVRLSEVPVLTAHAA
jgi:nucleotide-binding universal stress UspA family protein